MIRHAICLLDKRLLITAMVLCAALCSSMGHAAQCNPTIRPDDNACLKYRDFGNRCEGFFKKPVATSDLVLVSFTRGVFQFKRDAGEHLLVSLPFHPKIRAHVVAQGIPLKLHYRMDADLDAGATLRWPVNDIIVNCTGDLTSDQIGILARIDEGEPVYLPVEAVSEQMGPTHDTSLRLAVRAEMRVAQFLWRTHFQPATGPKIIGTYLPPENNRPLFRIGEPIIIKLPDNSRGRLVLEMAARPADEGQWIKKFVTLDLGGK
jgi:hypothetical protein